MKWRTWAVTLMLLAVFGSFSFLYFRFFIAPKTFSVVLIIAPGVDLDLLAASEVDAQATPTPLRHRALFNPTFSTLVRSRTTKDSSIDVATLMTSLATGKFGPPGELSLSSDGTALDTLLYQAQRQGRLVGLVTDGNLADPELSAFYAPVADPTETPTIAIRLIDSSKPSVILGGHDQLFRVAQRVNNRNLMEEVRLEGRTIISTRQDLANFASWLPGRVFGIFPFDTRPSTALPTAEPSLPFMTRRAIQRLQYNLQGYFLIVSTQLLARHPDDDIASRRVASLAALDETIHTALEYAGANSIVALYSPYSKGRLTSPHGAGATPVLRAESTGWLFLYTKQTPSLSGFIWPSEIHDYLAGKL